MTGKKGEKKGELRTYYTVANNSPKTQECQATTSQSHFLEYAWLDGTVPSASKNF